MPEIIVVESGSDEPQRPLVDVPLPDAPAPIRYLPYDEEANRCQDNEAYVWPEDDE